MSHKKVTSKRATFTKSEREYVKGIVHNLSLQRLLDGEIVQWLHDEKQIDIHTSLNIVDKVKQEQEEQEKRDRVPLMVDEEDLIGLEHEPSNPWHDYYQCDGCKRWWSRQELLDYHKKKSTKYECSSSMPMK